MTQFGLLLNIACGQPLPATLDGRASRIQVVATALLASIAFAALWGVAAGSGTLSIAVANVYKVPMVVLLSALSAIPAGLLAWKLSAASCRGTDLLLSFSGGVFAGTLVLAVLSPLLALYYRSSSWAGPVLGVGTSLLAIVVGTVVFVRGAWVRLKQGVKFGSVALPVVVFAVVQLAALLQLVALAAPILPERTLLSHGIDSIGRSAAH